MLPEIHCNFTKKIDEIDQEVIVKFSHQLKEIQAKNYNLLYNCLSPYKFYEKDGIDICQNQFNGKKIDLSEISQNSKDQLYNCLNENYKKNYKHTEYYLKNSENCLEKFRIKIINDLQKYLKM